MLTPFVGPQIHFLQLDRVALLDGFANVGKSCRRAVPRRPACCSQISLARYRDAAFALNPRGNTEEIRHIDPEIGPLLHDI